MIHLNSGTKPQVLLANEQAWTDEYLEWSQNRVGPEPQRYRHPQIRSALEAETHSKCAYCEGLIKGVAYTHIEHKLPKKNHPKMVCAWENLTIACPKCNTNKGGYDEPKCPLLDPYVDDVENWVAFYGSLALSRGGPRSRATITRLDLNRMDLVYERGQAIIQLDLLLELVERAMRQPDARVQLWLDIDAMIADAAEFASACRQYLRTRIKERGLKRP